MVNVKLFRDTIKDRGMTVKAVCEKSDITRQTLYWKYRNPDHFTIKEIDALRRTMRLSPADVYNIFFADNVK